MSTVYAMSMCDFAFINRTIPVNMRYNAGAADARYHQCHVATALRRLMSAGDETYAHSTFVSSVSELRLLATAS